MQCQLCTPLVVYSCLFTDSMYNVMHNLRTALHSIYILSVL